MALLVKYEDRKFVFDLEDMDVDDARAMERFGVKNLKALEEGMNEGDTSALTVVYWLLLKQNGEPGARLDHVKFKPVKLVRSLLSAEPLDDDEEEGKGEGA